MKTGKQSPRKRGYSRISWTSCRPLRVTVMWLVGTLNSYLSYQKINYWKSTVKFKYAENSGIKVIFMKFANFCSFLNALPLGHYLIICCAVNDLYIYVVAFIMIVIKMWSSHLVIYFQVSAYFSRYFQLVYECAFI